MPSGEDILAPAVEAYLRRLEEARPRSPVLRRLEEEAAREGIPIVAPATGTFLEVLVVGTRAERILEVGTATGYSAIRMAQKLPAWGTLDTIEMDPKMVMRARANLKEAGLEKRVNVLPGPALKVLPTIENRYDLVFIDAAKEEYEAYLARCLPLLPKGATVVVDNLLWGGRAATGDPRSDDPFLVSSTAAIRAFNEKFVAHPELDAQVLAIGDGVGFAVKR